MLDPRLRERPWVYLLGAIAFGGLSATCVYLLVKGAVTGVVLRAPARRNGFRIIYDRLSDDPYYFGADLFAWFLLALMFGAWAYMCWWWLVRSGGVLGTPDEKLQRRIAYERGRLDRGIFLVLANAVPGHWKAVRLELEWDTRFGEPRLRHRFVDVEGKGDVVQLPVHLYRTTGELLDVFRLHGQSFRKVIYSMARDAAGRWRHTVTTE